MAQQSMGQLHCGQSYGSKWNSAWSASIDVVFSTVRHITIDKYPQELFDQLIATAFWRTADSLGGVPKRVRDMSDVPERPKPWTELVSELNKFSRKH